VNPLAEQECAEMEERARFLAEQRGDLEAALAQLHEVITGLDEHIESSFSEIFESAQRHFLGGHRVGVPRAKGSLSLTAAKPGGRAMARGDGESPKRGAMRSRGNKPLGIAIEVKFPNKSPRSLTLLFRREKAMTAIAFLFSLFLARPCPSIS